MLARAARTRQRPDRKPSLRLVSSATGSGPTNTEEHSTSACLPAAEAVSPMQVLTVAIAEPHRTGREILRVEFVTVIVGSL